MKQCEAFFSLAVVFMAVFVLVSCSNPADNKRLDGDAGANVGNDENTEAAKITYPLMVKINGQVYQGMAYVNNNVTCGTADGKITSSVNSFKLPEKDNESNFGEGYEYQFWENDYVNVKIDGKWIVFKSLAISGDR